MVKRTLHLILAIAVWSVGCSTKPDSTLGSSAAMEGSTYDVLLSSEIQWQKLNPARGDQSPQAGTIWGDRQGSVATGFLAKFVDGFSSPPHIHNVTYRAVVIKGTIHNDGPQAEPMWMKPGSFWTQPLGEAHITAAQGAECIAYVEIDRGPYLVKPTDEAFDNGERPVNIDASNVVWLTANETSWVETGSGAELSFLWQDAENKGLFIKLPVGFAGRIISSGPRLRAVVIQGDLAYEEPNSTEVKNLDPGSYFTSTDQAVHTVRNEAQQHVLLYVRTRGDLQVRSL
ncbi:MAG: DUF4437 domain-containing protein [Bacteroidota bacterium]